MFPADMELEVGHVLQLRTESGEQFQAMVIELGEEKVTLDANHPLAGKDLTFDIELVEIK
jgi:peptidylprolyl isomerase